MAEKRIDQNSKCNSHEHTEHLCLLTDNYFHMENSDEYRAMVKDVEFKCEFCGRSAKNALNLCYPVKL